MASLADVFRTINQLKADGVFEEYAVAGGMAFLFYTEPALTYDVDVLVSLPSQDGPILDMTPLYVSLKQRGYVADAEHVMIDGVAVQFLRAYNALAIEAVDEAVLHDYDDVPVRDVSAEHLAALAIQTGGAKRRERVAGLISSCDMDRQRLNDVLSRHRIQWNYE